ncbi:MAG: FAD-binding protein [Planctomycetes bacterium]|nr:FAD-binding protein [Planctomycetota bacterium]
MSRVREALRGRIEGEILDDPVARVLYATDASIFEVPPLAVIRPRHESDVAAVLRYAADEGISVAARGAGSGVAGESLGDGIVLDFSCHMRAIQAPRGDRIRVEPGAVLDDVNRILAAEGRHFGPDPATSSRATLGGMTGVNSTGAHSLAYGDTRGRVRSLRIVLFDGTPIDLSPRPIDDLPPAHTRAGDLCRGLHETLVRWRDEIDRRTPRLHRNRHGYVLSDLIEGETLHIERLIAGSEGTLAIITAIELETAPLPPAKGLAVLVFEDRRPAAEAVVPLLEAYSPSALEILDAFAIALARTDPRYRDRIPEGARTLLLMEIEGESDDAVRERLETVRARFAGPGGPAKDAIIPATAGERDRLWAVRKAIVPLLFRGDGKRQPISLIEDAAVPPSALPAYLDGLDRILSPRRIAFTSFGHAGPGELHVRPFLDLRSPEDRALLRPIAREAADLVLSLGGTLSGEHGDGLLRSPYIPLQYGPLYDAFVEIKKAWDPAGILNPGKKVTERRQLPDELLRFRDGDARDYGEPELALSAAKLAEIVERCNGCAACRAVGPDGDMCPVFRATGLEETSPRAKANLLRASATGRIPIPIDEAVRRIASHCIGCRSCGRECPSGVDIPALALEIKARCARTLGLSRSQRAAVLSGDLLGLAGLARPIYNATAGLGAVRRAMDLIAGIDRRRRGPRIEGRRLLARHRFDSAPPPLAPGETGVAYFADLYADRIRPALGETVLDLLRSLGIRVAIPPQEPCGIVRIAYGDLAGARDVARRNVDRLLPFVRAGYAVVSSEPSAALAIREEYPAILEAEDVRDVAAAATDLLALLARLLREGRIPEPTHPVAGRYAYHEPCHAKTLRPSAAAEILAAVPRLDFEVAGRGCCGMAGTFGMRREGYDLSMRIGERLFSFVREDRFDAAASECSTCRMQIEHGTGKRAVHPVEILAEAYGVRYPQTS